MKNTMYSVEAEQAFKAAAAAVVSHKLFSHAHV